MKLIPYDVKIEFERHCGLDVKYIGHEVKFQWLKVYYQIPASEEPERTRSISCNIRNGIPATLRDTARRCAKSAFDAAYHLTGKRAADMKQLLQGKTV